MYGDTFEDGEIHWVVRGLEELFLTPARDILDREHRSTVCIVDSSRGDALYTMQ